MHEVKLTNSKVTERAPNADFRRKPQILADSPPSRPFRDFFETPGWKAREDFWRLLRLAGLETAVDGQQGRKILAENRRFLQKTADWAPSP